MRKSNKSEFWVVYRRVMKVNNKEFETNAVCEQSEWEAMELENPGLHTLIRDRIRTEEEAELLARGTSGDDYRNRTVKKPGS